MPLDIPPDGPDVDIDVPSPGSGPRSTRTLVAVAAVGGLLLAALLWVLRPLVHGLVYAVYTTPVVLLALPAAVVAFLAAPTDRTLPALRLAAAVFAVVLVVTAGVAGLLAGETLGEQTITGASQATDLAATDADAPRIVPRSVAARYASNTLEFPQYRIARSDVTVYRGGLHWSYALAPDGTWNYFTKPQHGTVLVDMTEQTANVTTVTGDLAAGIGTAPYNNYRWRTLTTGEYLVEYRDPFMVVHEGRQYVAVPYTKPEFHWLPLPHTTPAWGGVALLDEDGGFRDLSPAEARSHPALRDQRLYPSELARTRVAATKYRNGILNTFTSHRGEIEVAPVPGGNNDQPFLVRTADGLAYVVAVEPFGDAQGLREVWTVDPRTGEFRRFEPNGSLLGPRKATDFVRQAARTTDWDRFTPSEPIPVVVDGTLYWEVRVVPADSSGIAYVAFVNARTSDVIEAATTSEVSRFVAGEGVAGTGSGPDGDRPGEREAPALIVRRVAENGTVIEELRVYGDERLVVERPDGAPDGANETATDRP